MPPLQNYRNGEGEIINQFKDKANEKSGLWALEYANNLPDDIKANLPDDIKANLTDDIKANLTSSVYDFGCNIEIESDASKDAVNAAQAIKNLKAVQIGQMANTGRQKKSVCRLRPV